MQLPDRPIFVSPLPSQVTGVDFLGLAAINERLVALAFPGISNVTRYMRAYSAMSWMSWRFSENMKQQAGRRAISETEVARQFRRFREKVELLFTLGNPDFKQIAGQTRRDFLPTDKKRFKLEFAEFGKYKISWLDAAVYGPSLGVENGLGFIEKAPGQSYRPSQLGAALSKGLDESLRRSRYYDSLADIEENTGNHEMLSDLAGRWAVRRATEKERVTFRAALFPRDVGEEGRSLPANRVAMIELVLRAVKANGGTATVADVRQTIARGVTRKGRALDTNGCVRMQGIWSVLQLRQLQRLAHESLLRWVEATLLYFPDELSARTPRALGVLASTQAADYLRLKTSDPLEALVQKIERRRKDADFYLAGLEDDRVDPFHAIDSLLNLQDVTLDTPQLPGVALYALAICAHQAAFLSTRENCARWVEEGGYTRLSLGTLVKIFSSRQKESLAEFVEFLVGTCVVSQHFLTTGLKLEPNKNKYRFIPTDDGLRLLIRPNQLTRLNVTGDRLENAMQLMADCGMLEMLDEGDLFRLPR